MRGISRVHLSSVAAPVLVGWSLLALAEPIPEFYGFYAVDGGRLTEIKDSSAALEVSPQVKFIYFNRTALQVAPEAQLQRMALLRFESKPRDNGFFEERTTYVVTRVNGWRRLSGSEFQTELRRKPVPGQPEMVMYVPSAPLKSGAYGLKFAGDWLGGMFFVNKASYLETVESSAECIDTEFGVGWDGFRQQVDGGGRPISCVQSTLKEGTFCGPGSKVPGPCDAAAVAGHAAEQSPAAGRSAQYQNCISLGTKPQSCDILYPATTQAVDGAAASSADRTVALGAQLAALMQRAPSQPAQPDTTRTQEKLKVSFAYPATWELNDAEPPVVAVIAVPGDGIPFKDRTQITLTKSVAGPTVTLQDIVTSTIQGTRKTISNATIAGPVGTEMCGAEAQMFFVTGIEAGRFRQKAVTVAVSNGAVVGAVLHATLETFESAWNDYQRVVRSYTVE